MSIKRITATELARNLSAVLDQVRETGEEFVVERGRQSVAHVTPSPGIMSAEQALADLHESCDPAAAESREDDARRGDAALSDELCDPWSIDETVTLPSGGFLAYTLSGSVAPGWTDPTTNTASVTILAGLLELDGSNNSDSNTDRVGLFADSMESVEP